MNDISKLVEEPEIIKGNAEANRWQNYGKDRIYLNDNDFSGKYDAYIDLETGEFVCDYNSDFQMEIENGIATITKHWVGGGEEHSEVVIEIKLWEDDENDDSEKTEDEESGDEYNFEVRFHGMTIGGDKYGVNEIGTERAGSFRINTGARGEGEISEKKGLGDKYGDEWVEAAKEHLSQRVLGSKKDKEAVA